MQSEDIQLHIHEASSVESVSMCCWSDIVVAAAATPATLASFSVAPSPPLLYKPGKACLLCIFLSLLTSMPVDQVAD
jgi:hypothetical protein